MTNGRITPYLNGNGKNGHPKNGHAALPRPDRSPPWSLESEQYLMTACVYDNHVIDELATLLKPEDFFRDIHGAFFRACIRLRSENHRVDFASVGQELARMDGRDHCEEDEYFEFVRSLPDQPHAVNYAYHAGIVKDRSIDRALGQASSETLAQSFSLNLPTAEKVALAEQRFFSIGETGKNKQTVRADVAIDDFWEVYNARDNHQLLGVPTGLRTLDSKLGGGLLNTQLIIAAARPGHGKTSIALRIGEHVASRGMGVQIFSVEMGTNELIDRLVGGVAKVNLKHLQVHSLLTQDERARIAQAAAQVAKWPLFINDATDWTVAEMAAEARRQKRQNDIGLLIIDYLQLLEGDSEGARQSRQEQVAKMSRGLKKLAKQLNIPILALSQLNRKSEEREDKRPRLADLRESGALEQDADRVFLLHYPERADKKTADTGIVELDVAKNRNGETGMIRLAFVKEYSRFEMLSPDQVVRYEREEYNF